MAAPFWGGLYFDCQLALDRGLAGIKTFWVFRPTLLKWFRF
jgi:hypothetical protein